MRTIILIEDERRAIDQLTELVTAIDPQILIKKFATLKAFIAWFEKAYINPEMPKPGGADASPEEILIREASRDAARITEFLLFIANHRLMAPTHAKLLSKINSYLKKKDLLVERDRIGVLFTAHEIETLELKDFAHPTFDNVIYKPFDYDVTKEKLLWAISPEEASQGEGLHKEPPHAEIEMLKDIIIDRVTSFGMSTVADREIEPGTLGRYYCPEASDCLSKGFYARCYECIPHPERPGSFRISYHFFGFSTAAILEHRKGLANHEKTQKKQLRRPSEEAPVTAVILDEEPSTREYLDSELPSQFTNIKTCSYPNLIDFLLELDPGQAADEAYAGIENLEKFFSPITFVFDKSGQTLLDIRFEDKESQPLDLDDKDLHRIKTLLSAQLDAEKKEGFFKFWKEDVSDPLTILFKKNSESRFYTLVQSQLLEVDKDVTREIQIRYATPDEIRASQRNTSKIPQNITMIMVSHKLAARRSSEFWEKVVSQLAAQDYLKSGYKRPKIFVISRKPLDTHEAAKQFPHFDDIFFSPFDGSYLTGKLKNFIPELKVAGDAVSYNFVDSEMEAFSSNIADVDTVSEVGLAMRYPRPLPMGTFRHFVIRFPEIEVQPRLLAKCVYYEEVKKKGESDLHHFIFFGLGENYNFMLRNWLMEQYSLIKQDEEKAENEANKG